jgi:hypothetical protein
MFVLVIGDAPWFPTSDLPLKTPGVDPASMVWVDPEDLGRDEEDDVNPLQRDDDAEDRDTGASHFGLRVFGPFETFEEGQLAGTMLAMDADYRVIPVDPVATVERQHSDT